MKRRTLYIAIVSALIAVPAMMGCNQHGSTLASVAVSPAGQSMVKGTTQQFTALGTFSNGMTLTWSQVVTWSSDNPTVATVSNTAGSNGLVTAVDYGTAVITAYDAANNISGTSTVKVEISELITVQPINPYMAVGTAHQFSAIALFSGGTVTQVITTYAKWEVVSTGDATITDTPEIIGNGIVTAGVIPGTTEIKATDLISGATGTTTLTVTNSAMASIALDPLNPIISLSTTTSQPFTAIGTFQDGSPTPSLTTTWTWSSSNTGAATIDTEGVARAVAAGTTTITAKDPITGISGNTTLTFQ